MVGGIVYTAVPFRYLPKLLLGLSLPVSVAVGNGIDIDDGYHYLPHCHLL
jgi:hypothetical protein